MTKKITPKSSASWTNTVFISAVALIAIAIAYFLLVHLPKQQNITLRKQTYEICKREWDEGYDKITKSTNNLMMGGVYTPQQALEESLRVQAREDGFLTECVEKRLNEYQNWR